MDRADIPYLRKGICGCADLRLCRLAILPTLLCANGFVGALACWLMKYFIHFLCFPGAPRVYSRIFALWDPKNTNLRVPQNNFSSLCPKSSIFAAFSRYYQHFRVPQLYFASADPCILPDIALLLARQQKQNSWQDRKKRSMTCVTDRFCYIR